MDDGCDFNNNDINMNSFRRFVYPFLMANDRKFAFFFSFHFKIFIVIIIIINAWKLLIHICYRCLLSNLPKSLQSIQFVEYYSLFTIKWKHLVDRKIKSAFSMTFLKETQSFLTIKKEKKRLKKSFLLITFAHTKKKCDSSISNILKTS